MSRSIDSIEHLLTRLPGLHIGIIGDFCLDTYFSVDMSASETSVETGLTTQPVAEQRYSLGGAGNVAANLKAMGVGTVRPFGVTGDDPFGRQMRRIMGDLGISDTELLVQEEDWDTHVFTKVLIGDEEQPRLDFGNFNRLQSETAIRLLSDLKGWLPELDILIVNQQVLSGIHNEGFRKQLIVLLDKHPEVPSIVDSRSYSAEFNACLRKINDREAAVLCGRERSLEEEIPLEEARQHGASLYRRWNKPLFLTRSDRGCLVCDAEGCHDVPGLLLLSRTDTVGAGDSFLAGAAAALAAGFSPREAAEFANLVAGVTVQKLFITGTASPEEILAMAREASYRYHPELAAQPQKARFYPDSEIEILNEPPSGRRFTHAIFDNDGTISTLRQGWEEVMEPVMIRSILGDQWREIDETGYHGVRERVRGYIDRTTGVQTLVQMSGLAEMVREFGYVPEEKILDEHGYKEIYNRELLQRIDKRIAKICAGELAAVDFTLKKAVDFLLALRKRGVRLYLASGTDQDDVIREAEIMGYAELFEGKIYGAIGDIKHEPKKKVLESILIDIELGEGEQVVTFGDGPVEIQETRKRKGLAVGVASDEVRRYGLNPLKRSRLIQAGADLIIPDFSQTGKLLELLFPEPEG
jgi:bifunctional ADP-heptose synthase (sugar kinase/adenylyltransferase)/beta-phosphoglucomutase-like phosphatase (HAD superfamily)